MNEWEIIGRFVDLDNRLRTLEGRPTVQEKPQPVATLCEVVEAFLNDPLRLYAPTTPNVIDNLRHALAAERKRAVLVKALVDSVRVWYKDSGRFDIIRARLHQLDALDKGGGMNSMREMTLLEFVSTLAQSHGAFKEYEALVNELAAVRSDRDALKARVEELENTIDCGCNALTDSICCSGNDADTNLGFVRKMKRVLIGNNNTTPGGDE